MVDKVISEQGDEELDDDVELVPVETPPEAKPEPKAEAEVEEHDDEDDEDEGDERLASSTDDDEEGVLKKRTNRELRQQRRDRRKRAEELSKQELAFLRQQNDQLMQRLSAVENHALTTNEQTLGQQIEQQRQRMAQAEMVMARAMEAGNGEDHMLALRARDEAVQQITQLTYAQQQVQQVRQQASAPQGVNPQVVSLAQQWMQANPWYNPQGADEDSTLTTMIDKQMVAEGLNPALPGYWSELTRRVSERLNTGAGDEDVPTKREAQTGTRKAPPVATGREHAPVSTKKEIYVTPERKQAMIDAGIWDDPVRRNQMLKAYASYDRSAR